MPTPTYIALANTTLSSASGTVTFSSIPATYRDLVLVCNATTSRSAFNIDGLVVRFNSDTANYSMVRMLAQNTGASSDTDTKIAGGFSGNSASPAIALLHIMDYSVTDKHKTVLARYNTDASYVGGMVTAGAARWASTSAITTITVLPEVGPNFNSGSTFSLYGIVS